MLGMVKWTTEIFVHCNISAMCTEIIKTFNTMIGLRQFWPDSESSLKIHCLKTCVFVTYLTKMIWVKPIIRPIIPLWIIRQCSTSVRLRFGHEKIFYDHSQPFHWFKRGSCQLLAKDWALNLGKPKMCRRAIKHQHNQPASARWNMQGKRNCYNIMGSITSNLRGAR